jgi:hypothetical protein
MTTFYNEQGEVDHVHFRFNFLGRDHELRHRRDAPGSHRGPRHHLGRQSDRQRPRRQHRAPGRGGRSCSSSDGSSTSATASSCSLARATSTETPRPSRRRSAPPWASPDSPRRSRPSRRPATTLLSIAHPIVGRGTSGRCGHTTASGTRTGVAERLGESIEHRRRTPLHCAKHASGDRAASAPPSLLLPMRRCRRCLSAASRDERMRGASRRTVRG